MKYKHIHPADLMNIPDSCILDVRTTAEVQTESLPGSIHIPLHELTPEKLSIAIERSGKNGSSIYLLCQSGKRAEMAAHQLGDNINAELCIIEGGMDAVKKSRIPLKQSGRKVMSLERQVRIAAGFLVLCGVILGMFVMPQGYLLSGFVGAGLMFAGITDTCMIGMLIARMPWNK